MNADDERRSEEDVQSAGMRAISSDVQESCLITGHEGLISAHQIRMAAQQKRRIVQRNKSPHIILIDGPGRSDPPPCVERPPS
jgi:hypothetical protein